MKKMIKMSLVAAVAVAGFSSTASAANLVDAIKGTQLNGYVRYRLNTNHEANTDTDEETKAVLKFTSKVNDTVTANLKMVAIADTASGSNASGTKGQTVAPLNVTEGNFVIKAGGATVIAGLQTSQSPFFANNGDTRSHGFTALVPAGPATIAAAYYTTTVGGGLASPAMTNNVLALGALVKAGPANVNLWYADVQDGADVSVAAENDGLLGHGLKDASATSIEVTAAAGPVNIQLMKTTVTNDDTDTGMTKLVVSGKAGAISYLAGYAKTEKDGGMVALDQDDDSKADLAMKNHAMSQLADTTGILVGASMPVGPVTAGVNYLTVSQDSGAKIDGSELDVKVSYKMSKNFGATLTYGKDGGDLTSETSRIEVKYTF